MNERPNEQNKQSPPAGDTTSNNKSESEQRSALAARPEAELDDVYYVEQPTESDSGATRR